jgi:hypothetical protein
MYPTGHNDACSFAGWGRAEVRLQILHMPGCPGAEALASRLAPLLAARPHLKAVWQAVTTEDDARRHGMTGSPTILADGADLFARQGRPPSLSCRLYPDEHGQLGPAPTTAQLRAVLGAAAR